MCFICRTCYQYPLISYVTIFNNLVRAKLGQTILSSCKHVITIMHFCEGYINLPVWSSPFRVLALNFVLSSSRGIFYSSSILFNLVFHWEWCSYLTSMMIDAIFGIISDCSHICLSMTSWDRRSLFSWNPTVFSQLEQVHLSIVIIMIICIAIDVHPCLP